GHTRRKLFYLKGLSELFSVIEGGAFSSRAGVNRSLSKMVTRNNSGALPLTIKRLTSWRGYAQQRRIYFYGRALRRALG
ncbi:MAG: hypothetical protein WA579_00985, partial [Rhodomicrobium sp.]